MSKKVELIRAEVVSRSIDDETVLKEFKTEKGTVMSWKVRTRVNDKTEKSPVIFDNCSVFADTEERAEFIRNTIRLGVVLDIKGYEDRRKGSKTDDKGKPIYYSNINVKEIVPITTDTAAAAAEDENLPF